MADGDRQVAGGFSGAPIWDPTQGNVIGMVATIAKKEPLTYAIPPSHLDKIAGPLQLCCAIERCGGIENLKDATERAFGLCGEQVDQTSTFLLDRLIDVAELPTGGRCVEDTELKALGRWVGFLAIQPTISDKLVQYLRHWCDLRSLDFYKLYTQSNRDRQKRGIATQYATSHCVVTLRPQEETTGIEVRMWAINPNNPPELVKELVKEDERSQTYDSLARFIDETLDGEELQEPVLHLFVPRSDLSRDFYSIGIDDDETLGEIYPLLMRCDEFKSPRSRKAQRESWENLQNCMNKTASRVLAEFDCSTMQPQSMKQQDAVVLLDIGDRPVDGVLLHKRLKRDPVPIALWSCLPDSADELRSLLTQLSVKLKDLPRRLQELREENADDKTALENHLHLVWEDPNIMPPTSGLQMELEDAN